MEKISNTPEGVLVRLKNKICILLGIDAHLLKLLIDRFVTIAFNGTVTTKLHFAKVNNYNDLTKPKMTIKVFFKFLKIISVKYNISSIRITIDINTAKGDKFTVHEDISLFNSGADDE